MLPKKSKETNKVSITVMMALRKETEGAYQYREIGNNKIGTCYIRKTALEGMAAPDLVKVTVEGQPR